MRRRGRAVFFATFVLLFVSALASGANDASDCASSDAWRDPQVWSRLRRGLSRADVVRILGDPGKTVVYAGFERWEYPDLRGGRVHFDDRGRTVGWRPPPPAPAQ